MNTDRLLTRVFDKQEKKMIYPIGCLDLSEQRSILLKDGERVEIICLCPHTQEITYNKIDHDGDHLGQIEFGDRFVPMMCMGKKSKNNLLFYQHDIIKTYDNCLCTIEIDEDISSFVFHLIGSKRCNFPCTSIQLSRAELLGNRWENPELMEVKA
jgi:hypothetical protein